MKQFIFTFIFILTVSIGGYSQTITLTPIGTQSVSGIPVTVEHQITTGNGITSVKIFSTHFGTGNTSQYSNYPLTRTEMDRLFNTSWLATTLAWSGNMNATSSLNFSSYTTLTSAGATVPNNGDYYSTEITFTMIPLESGTYFFRLTSDDGSDLMINGVSVIEYYGGKGIGTFRTGSYNMVANQHYTVVARMQEYTGGDGLILQWRRPSQFTWSLHLNEIGIPALTWMNVGTINSNILGQATFPNPNNRQYRVTVDVSQARHLITTTSLNYMMFHKAGLGSFGSWDYYTCDCDNSSTFNWNDIYWCYMLYSNGFFHNKYIFTELEKTTIESNPNINYYNTYFPTQIRTIENQNRFYIMGTGIHKTTTQTQTMQ